MPSKRILFVLGLFLALLVSAKEPATAATTDKNAQMIKANKEHRHLTRKKKLKHNKAKEMRLKNYKKHQARAWGK